MNGEPRTNLWNIELFILPRIKVVSYIYFDGIVKFKLKIEPPEKPRRMGSFDFLLVRILKSTITNELWLDKLWKDRLFGISMFFRN